MKLNSIFIVAFIIIVLSGCKKSDDSGNDYASNVIGTYGGAVPPGILSGKLVVSRQSNTKVNIDINATHYENATVYDGGAGKFTISLTTSSTTIMGTVNGTIFDCYFNQLRFYGIKQ